MGRIAPEILARLFEEHAPALVLYARQWSEVPEDIVQDAFLTLAGQGAVPDNTAAWLFRVVRNRAISAARKSWRARLRERKVHGNEAERNDLWFNSTDDQIDAQHATRLLQDLDAETREVIIARVWGGLTFDEIAKLQGSSLTTTHRRYQSGLARLHARLESPWTNPKNSQRSTPTT
jgi:RNA polymerase sigma-70 factor (ECF subfamily)